MCIISNVNYKVRNKVILLFKDNSTLLKSPLKFKYFRKVYFSLNILLILIIMFEMILKLSAIHKYKLKLS